MIVETGEILINTKEYQNKRPMQQLQFLRYLNHTHLSQGCYCSLFVFDLYQMMSFSDHEAVTSSLTFWRSLDGMGENKIKIPSEMEAAPPHTRCLCSAVAYMPIYLTKWLQRLKSVAHNGLWEL